jgi:hypothetical protein
VTERPLRESLDALRKEIERIEVSHPQDRERLRALFADLEHASTGSAASGAPSLRGRVREAILHVEVSHPKLTAVLNELLESLGNVGM